MPVEIRELIIKAVVNDDHSQRQEQNENPGISHDNETIIQECVKQVLKILKKTGER
jgi:hypothetical protein